MRAFDFRERDPEAVQLSVIAYLSRLTIHSHSISLKSSLENDSYGKIMFSFNLAEVKTRPCSQAASVFDLRSRCVRYLMYDSLTLR